MKIAAIICEFNPFSEGHKYLIDNVRRDLNPDAVVCIMSGNYVQRGKPAVENKWKRTQDALDYGVDLVLQIPVCASLSSAEYFAACGVNIAQAINADYLCFGSECGDMDKLKAMADGGIEEIEQGNNILAAEYLRNIENKIVPWTVKINESLGHASDHRTITENELLTKLYPLLQYRIISSKRDELTLCPEVSEGLENRIAEKAAACSGFDELVMAVKSKRYTYSRISRIMMQILLGLSSSEPKINYAHVLGFSDKGRKIIKASSEIKLYTNIKPSDAEQNSDLALDIKADNIYSQLCGLDPYKYSDYVCKPCKSNI